MFEYHVALTLLILLSCIVNKPQKPVGSLGMQKLSITMTTNKSSIRNSGNESTMDVAALQAQLQDMKEKVRH